MSNGSDANGQSVAVAEAPAVSADVLQHLIDEAAHFNLLSVPAATAEGRAALRDANGIVGVRVDEVLHRLEITSSAPTTTTPLQAQNRVGEAIGRLSHRWMITPDDFVATPGQVPPPTPLDPTRAQRFVMLDSECYFGDDGDGFRGFGTGHTLPSRIGGQPELLVTAVGTILEGFGKFAGHEAGTYLYCGTLAPLHGFTGNLLLRVMDPEQTLRTERSLATLQPRPSPEEGITYLIFRGEAVPSDPVSPNIGPNGQPIGVIVEQGLRLLYVDSAARGRRGVRATTRVGQLIGRITAHVVFDPASASGTALDPIPFTTYDEIVFTDSDGQTLGTMTGESSEGRVFNLLLAGQPAIRFGGVGRILQGTGPFAGIEGLLTDNSVVAFTPHVSASVYLLRLVDPEGRFRAAL